MPALPRKRVWSVGYNKVVGTVRALFLDPALAGVLAGLRDYCFQQGASTNANPRDRSFFDDVLCHDLIFFEGDQGHPIVDDLPIDAKVYNALPHMQASLLELFRVRRSSLLGRLELEALLRGGTSEGVTLDAQAGWWSRLGEGTVFLGRARWNGRGYFAVEPRLRVAAAAVEPLVRAVEREHAACRSLFGELEREAFLKVASYHVYEYAAGLELARALADELPAGVSWRPRLLRAQAERGALALAKLPGARVAEEDEHGASIVFIDDGVRAKLHPNVREPMIAHEGQEIVALSFLSSAEACFEALRARLPASAAVSESELEPNEVYRALRHTIAPRG